MICQTVLLVNVEYMLINVLIYSACLLIACLLSAVRSALFDAVCLYNNNNNNNNGYF